LPLKLLEEPLLELARQFKANSVDTGGTARRQLVLLAVPSFLQDIRYYLADGAEPILRPA
jgi:hypothetical protein